MPDNLRRILAIFRKDARRFWPHLSIFAVLLALAAALDPSSAGPRSAAYHFYLASFALPLASCSLIAMAIHEDRLVGDRQYWLARPYARHELFAAKLLFVAAFVQLPILLQQAAILTRAGISPAAHWESLLGNQITLAIFLMLPAAALAAVTRDLAQMVLAALLVSLGLFWFLFQGLGLGPANPRLFLTTRAASAIVVGAAAVLLIQYARHRTGFARAAVAATVLFILLTASREQMVARFFHNSHQWRDDVRITLDPSPARRGETPIPSPAGDMVRIDIPIQVAGVPAGLDFATDDANLGLHGPGLPAGSGANRVSGISRDLEGRVRMHAHIKRDDIDTVGGRPANLYGSLELTLFRDPWTSPLPPRASVKVPGVGVCIDRGTVNSQTVECLTPKPKAAVQFEPAGGDGAWIIRPGLITGQSPRPMLLFHYDFPGGTRWTNHGGFLPRTPTLNFHGFGVLESFQAWVPANDESAPGRLIARTPVDHFRVAFHFDGLRLQDYMAGR